MPPPRPRADGTGRRSDRPRRTRADADATIVARYPQARSALLPMLHLVQSRRGLRSRPTGIEVCAEHPRPHHRRGQRRRDVLHDVQAPPGRRLPRRRLHQHAVRGDGRRRDLRRGSSEHLGVGHDETTADGTITLEHIECNAACDYAPVMMVNWEFFDNQTPESAVAAGRRPARRQGRPLHPRRRGSAPGARPSGCWPASTTACADEGPAAGPASLVGPRDRPRATAGPRPVRRRRGTGRRRADDRRARRRRGRHRRADPRRRRRPTTDAEDDEGG